MFRFSLRFTSLLLTIIAIGSLNSLGQEKPELIIPKGISDWISRAEFNNNGTQLILSVGQELQVWDVVTGKFLSSLFGFSDFEVDKKQNRVYVNGINSILVWNLDLLTIEDTIDFINQPAILNSPFYADYSPYKIYAIKHIAESNTLIIRTSLSFFYEWHFNVKKLKPIYEGLKPASSKIKKYLNHAGFTDFSPMGDYLVYEDYLTDTTIEISISNNRKKYPLLSRVISKYSRKGQTTFSSTGKFVFLPPTDSIREVIFDLKQGEPLLNVPPLEHYGAFENWEIGFSKDDSYAYLKSLDSISLYRTSDWKLMMHGQSTDCNIIDNQLITLSNNYLTIINLGTQDTLFQSPIIDASFYSFIDKMYDRVVMSSIYRKAIIFGHWSKAVRLFTLSENTSITLEAFSPDTKMIVPNFNGDTLRILTQQGYLTFPISSPSLESVVISDTIEWIDFKVGKALYSTGSNRVFPIPILTDFSKRDSLLGDTQIYQGRISQDGSLALFDAGDSIHIVDLKKKTILYKYNDEGYVLDMNMSSRNRNLIILNEIMSPDSMGYANLIVYDLKDQKTVFKEPVMGRQDFFGITFAISDLDDDNNKLIIDSQPNRIINLSSGIELYNSEGKGKLYLQETNKVIFFKSDSLGTRADLFDLNNDSISTVTLSEHDYSSYYVRKHRSNRVLLRNNYHLIELDLGTLHIIEWIPDFSNEILDAEYVNDDSFVIWNAKSFYLVKIDRIKKQMNMSPEFIPLDGNNYVIKHNSGLFEAPESTFNKLYFVQKGRIIDFSQLKERYYEPGLWRKIMNGEKLRDVGMFNTIELPPDIIREEKKPETVIAKLVFTNLEGGIGQITVSVNGLEIIEDLRPKDFNPKQPSWTYELKLSTLPNLKKGEENLIEIRAWNEGHWVISRPLQLRYTPPATKGASVDVSDAPDKPIPSIYILSCGVSDYTNEGIDLKYAAKDAEAMANALQLGAKKLFGIEKAFIYTLTDNSPDKPSKVNIQKTFHEISKKSSPNDVFVVYLSGHGINYGGDNGDFYYLTNEAYSTDLQAYNDPAQRANATISSKELIELFKTVPSDKRVLMIDACASGKMVENLVSSRDISSSTLRALDRLRDRTGFHIITGCAADAVSYEASRFGQGVLTYSLIEGIKGASLKENKFVDVNQLFQYAKERVPVLAKGIGGIQSPQVFSPTGAQSFDIGELDDATKKLIPLPKTRPVFVRSNFMDEQKLRDVAGLTKKLDEALNEVSSKGESANLLFVDVAEYPESCQLSGLYKQVEGKITLRINKMCDGKESTMVLGGKNVDELIEKIKVWMQ